MKKILPLFITLAMLSGCKNALNDLELNDNPYDQSYEGPQIVRITKCTTVMVTSGGTLVARNKIELVPATQMYQKIKLYRNGTLLGTMNRLYYGAENIHEVITDNTPVIGTTYSYQVSLISEESETQLSDAVSYTTTP